MIGEMYPDLVAASAALFRGRLQILYYRPRHQLCPDDEALLVDVERRAVVRGALLVGRRRTDERECSRHSGEEARHVLSAHGADAVNHTFSADDVLCYAFHHCGHLLVVYQRL